MTVRNPRLVLVGACAAVSAIAIGVTLVERVHTEQQFERQATQNCVGVEDLKAAITDVLQDGRDRLIGRRDELEPRIYRDSLAYYDRQLARFEPKEC